MLLGTGDVNHWGAWQIEEAALKTHIEPLCEMITAALTEKYLWPVLEAMGQPTDFIAVAADTSDLRLRPDRSNEAFQMYDRLEIGGVGLRRETGFDEGDAPDPAELQAMLLQKVATGTATPDLAAAALAALGVPLTPAPSTVEGPAAPPEVGPAPVEPPAVEDNPDNTREPPALPAAASALMAAAWPLAHRAVERARNKHSARSKTFRPVPRRTGWRRP